MILEKDFKISVKQLAVTSSRLTTTVSIVKIYNQDISDLLFSQASKKCEKRPKSLVGIEPTEQSKSFVILVRCLATELSVVSMHRRKSSTMKILIVSDDPRCVIYEA